MPIPFVNNLSAVTTWLKTANDQTIANFTGQLLIAQRNNINNTDNMKELELIFAAIRSELRWRKWTPVVAASIKALFGGIGFGLGCSIGGAIIAKITPKENLYSFASLKQRLDTPEVSMLLQEINSAY